ncbi:choline transporter-like family protein [Rhodotorula toruloides]|uniref:Protein PNS1 n=1 Tax=Rhodotorula toruloides TaxID=5286 RepID=A0A511KQW8_RHOTO|nr:choline transporter-like family protein [Rhodotorula toruloides]
MDFSQFASNLLASSSQPAHAQQPPLFISSRADRHPRSLARDDGDVLGSVEGEDVVGSRTGGRKGKGKMWVDDGLDEDGHEGSDDDDGPPASLVAPRTGTHGVVPAFVSKFGMTSPATGGVGGRGWKAYESIAASAAAFRHGHGTRGTARAGVVYSDGEGSSEEDEEDDGPLPGAFVSQREYAMDEPLVGVDEAQRRKETLYVYPVPATEGEADPPGYRDSGWIVAYGLSTTSPAVRASTSLLSTALPSLSLLTLISLFAGLSTLAYLLVLSHSLRTLLTLSILGAPFVFSATGIIAFAGSFGTSGVEADRGWKTGMRVFSVACFALAFAVGGEAVKRRKEMDRAINVGETVLSHPPLVVLALALSLTSLALTIPCLTIIASLLSLSPTHPHLASYGTAFTLLVYLWSLAILRGISHATVGGVVGWWYFEREEEEEGGQGVVLGPMEVTRAAVARATGPSLGTVIAFSFFLSLFTTISTTLLTLSRLLRSSRIPTPLRPITALFAGLFTSIAASTAFFNSYALSYAGMTGQPWSRSTRETASLIRSNRARNIRDTALLRLTLFTITTTYSLLAGLLSFLLTSSSLAPSAGGYAPTLAILSYVIPAYTVKLCHDLVGDCVDALWVCVSLEASEGEGAAVVGGFSRCPKAVEAFGTPESETFNATAFV